MMKKPRILFMGTSPFAVPPLYEIFQAGWPIIAVVTPPDRPQGRGRMTAPPPLKTAAQQMGLPIIQTPNVKETSFLETFQSLAPELVIVAAFGQILPRSIISKPPEGCINIHPSLLPKYRGAAPINWAIINGEEKTGVTVMKMDEGMDSGDILMQEETIIGENENFGQLHDRLAKMGANLLLKTLSLLPTGNIHPKQQDHALATFAPVLDKKTGLIDWKNDCRKIAGLIRGLSPVPCAYTFIHRKKLKIFSGTANIAKPSEAPGTIKVEKNDALCVAAPNGYIYLEEVQLEGKKRMKISDFLRGTSIATGEKLGPERL
jgi:methionyl-tRNA formyltransferase